MPESNITFDCPGCTKRFSAQDKLAGRKTKCPKCGATFRVPAQGGSLASTSGAIPQLPWDDSDSCDATHQLAQSATVASQRNLCRFCGNEIATTEDKCCVCSATNDRPVPAAIITPLSCDAHATIGSPVSHDQPMPLVHVAPPLVACEICGRQIANTTERCPECGAQNDWLHPEIKRFYSSHESAGLPFLPAGVRIDRRGRYNIMGHSDKKVLVTRFRDEYTKFLLWFVAGLSVVLITARVEWQLSWLFVLGVIGAGVVGIALFGKFKPEPIPYTAEVERYVFFDLDFSFSPPKWTCNDEEYWAPVRKFFKI
jgi:hypothetical protein